MTNDDATFTQQLSTLRQEMTTIREIVNAMKSDNVETKQQLVGLQTGVRKVERLLLSNPEEMYLGLIERVTNLEKITESLQDGREKDAAWRKGLAAGLGFTGATGIVTVARLFFGGP